MFSLARPLARSPLATRSAFVGGACSQRLLSNASFVRFQASLNAAQQEAKPKLSCQEVPAKKYSFNEIKQLASNPDKTKVLIDVREPAELQENGYIPTALNVPFKSAPGALNLPEDEFEDVFSFPKPSTDKELIFYCHSGVRSTAAEELANTFGYSKRGNYEGSFADWVKNGGKVAKKE